MALFSYSILSIDGGGIRGIIPCTILAEIEKRTGQPIAKSFDLMAGTSTGGILTSGLSITGKNGEIANSAEKLLDLYKGEKGRKIFKKPLGVFNKIRLASKTLFKSKNIEKILSGEFGDARLKDTYDHTNLLVTSYDTHNKMPFYFRSRLAKVRPEEDYPIKEICRATSAAPTFFPPKALPYQGQTTQDKLEGLSLIDGGVFANNPSVLAYVEAMELWKEDPFYKSQFKSQTDELLADKEMMANPNPDNFAPPILFVSLGTGKTRKSYPHKDIKGWGAVKWIRPLIDILMQGVSESVDYQMQYLLPPFVDSKGTPHPRYYRMNIDIDESFADFSDTSKKNVKRLEQYGKEIVQKYDKEIDEICQLLQFVNMQRENRVSEKEMV